MMITITLFHGLLTILRIKMDEQTKDVVTVIGKSRAVNFTGVPYCVEEVDSKYLFAFANRQTLCSMQSDIAQLKEDELRSGIQYTDTISKLNVFIAEVEHMIKNRCTC